MKFYSLFLVVVLLLKESYSDDKSTPDNAVDNQEEPQDGIKVSTRGILDGLIGKKSSGSAPSSPKSSGFNPLKSFDKNNNGIPDDIEKSFHGSRHGSHYPQIPHVPGYDKHHVDHHLAEEAAMAAAVAATVGAASRHGDRHGEYLHEEYPHGQKSGAKKFIHDLTHDDDHDGIVNSFDSTPQGSFHGSRHGSPHLSPSNSHRHNPAADIAAGVAAGAIADQLLKKKHHKHSGVPEHLDYGEATFNVKPGTNFLTSKMSPSAQGYMDSLYTPQEHHSYTDRADLLISKGHGEKKSKSSNLFDNKLTRGIAAAAGVKAVSEEIKDEKKHLKHHDPTGNFEGKIVMGKMSKKLQEIGTAGRQIIASSNTLINTYNTAFGAANCMLPVKWSLDQLGEFDDEKKYKDEKCGRFLFQIFLFLFIYFSRKQDEIS